MEMTEEKTAAESKGDEKSGGGSVGVRCHKKLVNNGQECVKPDGHEPPCEALTWWCVEHNFFRLGPDCLCIKCVDSMLTERWKESVGLQQRITNLVDEVGHQWSRIKKLECSDPDRRVEEVLVQSFQRVTTLREVLKLVCQAPTVLSAYRAVMNGKSPVQAMEESLQAVERERVAIVRAEHREARALLHEAFALYEAWKAKQAFYMKSSKLG